MSNEDELREVRETANRLLREDGAEIKRLADRLSEFEAVAKQASETIGDLLYIVNRSEGVVGWHANGDILHWEQFSQISDLASLADDIDTLIKSSKEQG